MESLQKAQEAYTTENVNPIIQATEAPLPDSLFKAKVSRNNKQDTKLFCSSLSKQLFVINEPSYREIRTIKPKQAKLHLHRGNSDDGPGAHLKFS